MRRLQGSSGSAIVFALVAVMLISTLGLFTVARASDSDTRSGGQKVSSAADAAADAAVAASIARIQRVGSVAGSSDEARSSILDASGVKINGLNDVDGTFSVKVQSNQPGCYQSRQRLMTVTAKAQGQTRRRYLCFWVVPRVLRFGLYADGRATAAEAVTVNPSFSLLMPPPYKAPTGARGSDLGANKSISFAPGALANDRSGAVSASISSLYDNLFVPSSGSASQNAGLRFGTTDKPGIRWGSAYVAPKLANGLSSETAPTLNIVSSSGVNFESTADTNNEGVKAATVPIRLATRSQPPDFSQQTKIWRSKARSQGNLFVAGIQGAKEATPDDFQSQMNNLGSEIMQGVVYVGCDDQQTITIPAGKQLTVEGGALLMEGCNLTVETGGGLSVKRDLSNPYYLLKGSNGGSCDETDKELAPAPGGCAWAYPGLAVLSDSAGRGGNVDSKASGSAYVEVNGNVIVGGDLMIEGGALPTGGKLGNWTTSGSTFVDGKFSASGAGGAAVFRWVPLAQRMDFDPASGRMGTYSIRTEERALPTSAPELTLTSKPDNPSDQIRTAEFAWDIEGSYDTVACSLVKDGAGAEPISCSDTAATVNGLDFPANYTFKVEACVLGLDPSRTQKQFCSSASWDFYIKGPKPTVSIDASSKPSNPSYTQGATFTWSIQYNPTSVSCRVDSGTWADCQSPPGYTVADLSKGQSHSFDVRACNFDGCSTDSYSWTVADSPTVLITNKPSSPQPYTATSVTLGWTVSGGGITSTQCSINGGTSWIDCSTATSHTLNEMNTGTDQSFKVKVCNPAGCGQDSAAWSINPSPPTVTFTTKPVNPSDTSVTSPAFVWSLGGGPATSQECKIDGGLWASCTGTSLTRSWSSCADHTFEVRAGNVSGTGTSGSYAWRIKCPTPTLLFTSVPANPSATFNGSGVNTADTANFAWQVTNSATVTGYECKGSGASADWAACSTAGSTGSYATTTLSKNAVNGVGHIFYVRASNESGAGAAISYSWTVYPNKPSTPTWATAPPAVVDYNVGSASGVVNQAGAAAEPQCYTGSWTACSWTPSFGLGAPGSTTTVYFRAHNISGDSANLTASVRRYSNPPAQWLYWNGDHGRSRVWYPNRYITQSAIEGQFSGCYMYKGTWWGEDAVNTAVFWSGSGGCNNPSQINVYAAGSCLRHDSYMRANDSSRTGVRTQEAGSTNSTSLGWNCSATTD